MLEFGFSREDITPHYGIGLCGYLNPRHNRGAYPGGAHVISPWGPRDFPWVPT